MSTPMVAGQTASLVTRYGSRQDRGRGGTSFPFAHDPRHRRAWYLVEHEAEDWTEVRADGPYPAPLVFRAWRVSAVSWAWQTSAMAAPAFAPYRPHDPLVTDRFGTYCPGCERKS